MKNCLLLPCLVIVLILSGCSDNNSPPEPPAAPDAISIDVDDDGLIDFNISYILSSIFSPISSQQLAGIIIPVGENEILHQTGSENLFLRDVSLINQEVEEPLVWTNTGFSHELITIKNNIEGNWPAQWTVNSNELHPTYFLGLKMNNNSNIKTGWIELQFDLTYGAIMIIEKGIL